MHFYCVLHLAANLLLCSKIMHRPRKESPSMSRRVCFVFHVSSKHNVRGSIKPMLCLCSCCQADDCLDS
ncbi:hypothetical protein M438DRAFT_68993 [Aureobasidium pullulans EXF-150]|uniref:Secreted protein n=1 Tax=Aureobasidium pullulans EXF-150 TaxID=1043002 RepID=A0A074X869_AURPU|nr:uncharacterized protein M438DRAFT_68993 [Aureobasidium pullulans EXF-150]KEQ81680.1 hypothetical protein M438DRAFT_68993 [Aureobasidium pullulans EXF-150]